MIIAEQFGFAIIPLCFLMSSGLISGITNGTLGCIRKALVLSITTAPVLIAWGTNFVLTKAPGLDKPISATGNFRSSKILIISLPTAPLAPTTATLYEDFFFMSVQRIA